MGTTIHSCKTDDYRKYFVSRKRKRHVKGKISENRYLIDNDDYFDEKASRFNEDLHLKEVSGKFKNIETRSTRLKNEDKELTLFNQYKAKFERELLNLMINHKDKYVAIVKDEIIIEDNEDYLIDEMIKKYGDITMYISKITDKVEEVGTISSVF